MPSLVQTAGSFAAAAVAQRFRSAQATIAVFLAIGSAAAAEPETPFGAYLAGRHAQETRDYAAAAAWFENALKSDPESPELISRTFLMEASEGRFNRNRSEYLSQHVAEMQFCGNRGMQFDSGPYPLGVLAISNTVPTPFAPPPGVVPNRFPSASMIMAELESAPLAPLKMANVVSGP